MSVAREPKTRRILADRELKREVRKRKRLAKAAGRSDVTEADIVRRAVERDQEFYDDIFEDDADDDGEEEGLRFLDGLFR